MLKVIKAFTRVVITVCEFGRLVDSSEGARRHNHFAGSISLEEELRDGFVLASMAGDIRLRAAATDEVIDSGV
jgi:hypothetical protein